MVFPAKNRWSLKKKVFIEISSNFQEIQVVFPAKNRWSPKQKGLHPKNVTKTGVSPQKTLIWASICAPKAPSQLISSRHSPHLGGTIFVWGAQAVSWGGTGPVCPPWRRVWIFQREAKSQWGDANYSWGDASLPQFKYWFYFHLQIMALFHYYDIATVQNQHQLLTCQTSKRQSLLFKKNYFRIFMKNVTKCNILSTFAFKNYEKFTYIM